MHELAMVARTAAMERGLNNGNGRAEALRLLIEAQARDYEGSRVLRSFALPVY